ncbi:CENP-B N domain containing protein [Trichuris trichiura]|uniref:CENP-B N domain containing protein n=1 Tax=Trichuris trichiura TaxID=36087 RepID=A0A077Z490_TRITR|nr:CENP-B N domain containing protein [Trichuris trichiura]
MYKKKRITLTIEKKVEIIKALKRGVSGQSFSDSYGVGRSMICDVRKNAARILEYSKKQGEEGDSSERKNMRGSKNEEIMEAVYTWFLQNRAAGVPEEENVNRIYDEEVIPAHFKRTSAVLEGLAMPILEQSTQRFSFLPGQIQRNLKGDEKELLVADIERDMNMLLEQDNYYATAHVLYAAKCAPGPQGPILVELKMRKTACKANLVPVLGTSDDCVFIDPPRYISCIWQGTALNGKMNRTMGVMCYEHARSEDVEFKEGIEEEICEMYKYPDSEVLRLIVPYTDKSWQKKVLVYKPLKFSTQYKSGFYFEDKLKEIERRNSRRRSDLKAMKNPAGRTGLAGKGALPNLGVNQLVIPVLLRDNHGIYEVLVEVTSFDRYGRVQLPQSFEADPETNILGAELTQAFEQLFTTTVSKARAREVFAQAKKTAKENNHKLYQGFAPDPRSTDDAWVEVLATVYMDKYRTRFGFFDLKEHENLLRYGWRSLKNVTDAKTQTILIQSFLPVSVNDALLGKKEISRGLLSTIGQGLKNFMLDLSDFFFTGLGLLFDAYVTGLTFTFIVSELFIHLGKLIANGKPWFQV